MEIHPLAKYFPPLEGEEFDLLVDDIKKNGLLEPITLHEDMILDGFNRYRACMLTDIVPHYKDYNGNDALSYVISSNIRRRHLTESQRAMLATEMLPEFETKAKEHMRSGGRGESVDAPLSGFDHGRATAEAGKQLGVSQGSVIRAKRVKEQAPERVPDVIAGKTSVRAVDIELREARAKEKADTRQDKQNNIDRQETPMEVKAYLDSLKLFKQDVETAINVAEYGKFAPEAMRFTQRKHNEIRELFNQLEGVFDG